MNSTGAQERVLAPGWRCEACEYSLEGLPNRADQTQCPECGHTAPPVRSKAARRRTDIALAAMLSMWCALLAGLMGLPAWSELRGQSSPPPDLVNDAMAPLAAAAGMLYVGVVAWGVPFGRWRVGRYVGATVPAALGAIWGWDLLRWGNLCVLPLLIFCVMALSFLLQPEINRWLRPLPNCDVRQ